MNVSFAAPPAVRALPQEDGWLPSCHLQNQSAVSAKRAFDLLATIGILICLSPVLLIIALLVRYSSPGPVLFRQTRIGQNGQPFVIFKFRTMFVGGSSARHEAYVRDLMNGEALSVGGTFKLANDPRKTPIGAFLRRTSLDELPQLLNVMRGDMSLVGPRPQLQYEVNMYDERTHRRLIVPPGMTGLWQVSGRSRLTFKQMVDLDLIYIERWSFWEDIRILFRTVPVVLKRGDAC